MKVSDEMTKRICAAVPSATPELVAAIFGAAAAGGQIVLAEGAEQKNVDGKVSFPNYLQVQINSAYQAGELARQLVHACTAALSTQGKLGGPVTLLIAGQALISE